MKHHKLTKFKALLAAGVNPNAHLPKEYGVMCEATKPDRENFLEATLAHGGNVNLYVDDSSPSSPPPLTAPSATASPGFPNPPRPRRRPLPARLPDLRAAQPTAFGDGGQFWMNGT